MNKVLFLLVVLCTSTISLAETNDPLFAEQWHYADTGITTAWEYTQGSDEIVIAIIDSGIDFVHEDLQEQIWVNQAEIPSSLISELDSNGDELIESAELLSYFEANQLDTNQDEVINLHDVLEPASPLIDGVDNDLNGSTDDLLGWSFTSNTNQPLIEHSHASAVAGIAAARTNNELGVAGTCQRCRLMNLRVAGDLTILPGQVAEAIRYATDNGASVINISLAMDNSSVLQSAVNYALAHEVTVVAGAGNRGTSEKRYPAAYAGVLSVGGTSRYGTKWSQSSFGETVDIAAPAQNLATALLSTAGNPEGYTLSFGGTSGASPHVAGAAALIKSIVPTVTPTLLEAALLSTTTSLTTLEPISEGIGTGLLNAARSIEVLGSDTPALRVRKEQHSQPVSIYRPSNLVITVVGLNFPAPFNLTLHSEHPDFVVGNPRAEYQPDEQLPYHFNNRNSPYQLIYTGDQNPFVGTVELWLENFALGENLPLKIKITERPTGGKPDDHPIPADVRFIQD